MAKPFSALASTVLLVLGIGQALWLWKAVNVTVNGMSLPIWVPIAGLVIALATSLGIAIETRRRPRVAEIPVEDATSRDIQRRPGKFTVKHGRRYKARIALGFFEQVASNEMIAEKFQEVGFSDVSVTGDGGQRDAIGRWNGADSSAQLPSQVVSAVEIVEPTVTASLTAAATALAQSSPEAKPAANPEAKPAADVPAPSVAAAQPSAPTIVVTAAAQDAATPPVDRNRR